jgi:hypothetical protein
VRLIVLEEGAPKYEISAWLPPSPRELDAETIVLQQSDADDPARAAQRIIQRVATLREAGRDVRRAVLLVSPQLEGKKVATRQLVARALCTVAPELVIAIEAEAAANVREHLGRLVRELAVPLKGQGGSVSLAFGAIEAAPVDFGPSDDAASESFEGELARRLGVSDAAARTVLGDWLQGYEPGPRAKALRSREPGLR